MDALTEEGDEGRGLAAISFGEVPCNLRSGDFRMGQPYRVNLDNPLSNVRAEQTLGSETSQYQEEKRPTGIPLVAASETGAAQTQPQYRDARKLVTRYCEWGYRLQRPATAGVELQNA